MFDKMLLAEGARTSRIEHVRVDVKPEDVNAWMDSLPAARVTAVETVDGPVESKQLKPGHPADKGDHTQSGLDESKRHA